MSIRGGLGLVLFAVIAAIAPTCFLIYNQKETVVLDTVDFLKESVKTELEVGNILKVRMCKVIDGYRFMLLPEGNNWIEAHLPVATKDGATSVVIECLNSTPQMPTIKLLRRAGNCWIVDFRLIINGKEEEMISFLKSKDLLLE